MPALAVAALAFADGGYEPQAWGWATLALLWVAGAALALRPAAPLSGLELASLAGLAGLAAWAALSAVWSRSAELSLLEAQRTLLLAVGLAAFLLAGGRGEAAPVARGVTAAATAVAAWFLVTVARPEWVGTVPAGQYGEPLGYPNALGALAALALVPALALAARDRRWLAPATVLGVALAATASRGAVLALAAGLAAAAALRVRGGLPLVFAGGLAAALASGAAVSAERRTYWTTTLRTIGDAPLLGSGAGTWGRTYLERRTEAVAGRDAHSLLLETLSELGPAGLALLALVLVPPLVAAWRARRRPLVPALAGGYTAFTVHAAADWDWEFPAVVLAALACAAALLAEARPAASASKHKRLLGPALAAGVALSAVVAWPTIGNALLARGEHALRTGAWAAAEADAGRAGAVLPWSAQALRVRGEAERARGDEAAAARSFRRALGRDASDPALGRALARVASGAERRDAQARAERLDPLGAGP